jgi:hypothetical protein
VLIQPKALIPVNKALIFISDIGVLRPSHPAKSNDPLESFCAAWYATTWGNYRNAGPLGRTPLL